MNKKTISIAEIFILVLGIIAIGYALGSEVGGVSGVPDPNAIPPEENKPKPSTTGVLVPVMSKEIADRINKVGGGDAVVPEMSAGIAERMNRVDAEAGGKGLGGALGKIWGGTKWIAKQAGIAAMIYYGVKLLGPFITSDEEAINSAAKAGAIGYLAGAGAKVIAAKIFGAGSAAGPIGIGVGIIVGGLVFVLSYKKTDEDRMNFMCYSWQAPLGGANCEKCNKGPFPCIEYQCKALGQGCELVNKGTNEELCIWQNRKDTKLPIIQPWRDALPDERYSYQPDNRVNPPDRGAFIKHNGRCIPAFTPFTFGITSDEPVICKVDTQRKRTFDEMQLPFGGSNLARYNHTQTISLPSNESLAAENITLQNGGNYELHVRCVDINGNPKPDSPSASFVFKYCVDPGPDTQAPIIMGTSLVNGMPIAYNQSTIPLEVYLNEPSECKWTHEKDVAFDQMENNMTCSTSVFQMNAQMRYKCSTTLTSLKSRQNNDFYFRCKDKPLAKKDRNVMNRGYKFTLQGTQPLVIDRLAPNGTIKDSVEPAKITLEVETSAGYKEGEATCYYSESCYLKGGSKTYYVDIIGDQPFTSRNHREDIWVDQGNYQCSIKCIDQGGNADYKETAYRVEVDARSPQVVRAYKESDYLKIITDEAGECVYDSVSCSYLFGDGIAMNTLNENEHYTDWNSDITYYVKCQDEYRNQPDPNRCTIIVKPFEIFGRT